MKNRKNKIKVGRKKVKKKETERQRKMDEERKKDEERVT